MHYRLYLLDDAQKIAAAEAFIANDDLEALETAAILFRSTNDVFAAYEVWCGPRHVTGAGVRHQVDGTGLVDLAEGQQIRMLDLEERLLSSFACVRRSRALLEATTDLLEGRNGRAPRDVPPREKTGQV